jgi:hypothetical protein
MQHAESYAKTISSEILASGFEFADFKISFSINLRAYLMRYIQIDKAEKALQKQYKIRAKNFKGGHTDFREVFKWITSPLIAREIGKPANLEGVFWVNCSFT